MNSSSSFSPFADIYPDAKKIETVGSTCDSYVVRRYGKLHFVKKLKSDLSADPRYVAAIQKEFNVGYNLDHPNIVRYEQVGNDYIVLDYVDGRTLKEIIKEDSGYFSNRRKLDKFVHQLLSAIGYMHQHGDHRFLAVCPFSGSSVANAIDICGICRRIRWHMSWISVAYAANVISLS